MRATTRTMWLLLSLIFLFVCSDVTAISASNNDSSKEAITTSVTTTATTTTATTTTAKTTDATTTTAKTTDATTTTATTTDATTTTATTTEATTTEATTTNATTTNAATTTPTTTKTEQRNESMQATTTQSNKAVINSTINVATATPRPTDTPARTSKPPSTPKQSISNTTTAAATSTTTTLEGTTITAKPVASPKALTTQMPEGSGTSKTPGSEASGRPDKGGNLTVAPTQPSTGQGSTISTTITSNLTQGDGERVPSTTKQADSKAKVTEASTVRNTSHEQTTPTAPVTTVHIGTTGSPHNLTKTGDYPTTVASGTTAGMSSLPAAITSTTAAAQQETFLYSLNSGHVKEQPDLAEVCKRLMVIFKGGNCTLTFQHSNGKTQINSSYISGNVNPRLANQYFEEITKKPTDNKTLIAILASCGALLIMIVILAVCASHHRKPFNENQQHLTEELHTVENGYHDNPTLEVMEVQPEMQEKKTPLNREFNDSWIVPFDNLLKEDMADEEDTHL